MTDRNVLRIDERSLEDAMDESREFVAASRLTDRKLEIGDRDQVVERFQHFLGTYLAIKNTLADSKHIEVSEDYFAQNALQDCYAGYVASIETLLGINGGCGAYTSHRFNKLNYMKSEFDKKTRQKLIMNDFLTSYLQNVPRTKHHLDLLATYLRNLVNQSKSHAKSLPGGFTFENKAEKISIQVNGNIFNGFNFELPEPKGKQTKPLEDTLSNSLVAPAVHNKEARFDDIIGNDHIKEALQYGILNILDYDAKTRRNATWEVYGFPTTTCIDGLPGTGKTSLLRAGIAYAYRVAEEHAIPFHAIHLTNSSFKSEYFAKSANNLKKVLDGVQSGDKSYLVVMEDFDTIFFSREESKHSPENKTILETLVNSLEGVLTVNRGNYLMIATSNEPLASDSALLRRLKENTLTAYGPQSLDEYVGIFRIHMKDQNNLGLKDSQWQQIAQHAMEYGFVGGDIKNVCRKVQGIRAKFQRPSGWYALSPDEKAGMLAESSTQTDTYGLIATGIEDYHRWHQEKRVAEREGLIRRGVERRLLQDAIDNAYTGVKNGTAKA